MKKRIKANIFLLIFSLVMFFASYYVSRKYSNPVVPKEHFAEITSSEAASIMENETAVIYFGRDECFWCGQAVPVLEEVLEKMNVQIYYADTEQTGFLWSNVKKYLGDYMQDDSVLLPLVVVCSDGQVIDGHSGTIQGQERGVDLSVEQKAELKKIYSDLIEKYQNEIEKKGS